VCVCVSGSFVPVASNLEPTQVQRQEVVTIRNIGPNRTGDMKNRNAYACTRIDTIPLPIPGQSVTYRHTCPCPTLRTCLFSSDAAQWWPGVWGWTGPAGHGLDRGRGGC
jgi:hypothetical protein